MSLHTSLIKKKNKNCSLLCKAEYSYVIYRHTSVHYHYIVFNRCVISRY